MSSPLVFITGVSGGIGQALAARFYRAGYRLALSGPGADEISKINAWAETQQLEAERYRIYDADVACIDSIVAAGHACLEQQGVPDVVIANAGIGVPMNTSERAGLDAMARTFAVNTLGLAATFQPFVRPMRERGSGLLVGMAGIAGIRGLPWHGAYGPSKAAAINYCECLRTELRSTGVKVLTICPGYIDTPLKSTFQADKLPFLMLADDFADRAFRRIEAGCSYSVMPWQMHIVAAVMPLLPNALYDRIAQKWVGRLLQS